MKFSTDRETLLRALSMVTGVVERRQTLPVLSNLLVVAREDGLTMTATDLEVELSVRVRDGVEIERGGKATIPGRKLVDIWRSLPEGARITVEVADQVTVRSGKSRFALATLPVDEYPDMAEPQSDVKVLVPVDDVRRLLDQTSFAMAQQDVRYFLNGMLFEITGEYVRTVATDGHRLAMCTCSGGAQGVDRMQAIVPRKGVNELARLLGEGEEPLLLALGSNHLRAVQGGYTLVSKLVDGQFPDYERVIPKNTEHYVTSDRETLRRSLRSTSILSNEKYRGVRLSLDGEELTVQANNPDQEEAEDVIPVEYDGDPLEIGFNADYLLDILNALSGESVRMSVSDGNSAALIEGPEEEGALFVAMPMRL
ncbi:MAG: DNA polymerase III subunit beta [Gammaproteobacteria bacterium]|nr:DNA polymerase III subunit beta [Gammaproteobacteria bacterium]